jgi:hypothetical protein
MGSNTSAMAGPQPGAKSGQGNFFPPFPLFPPAQAQKAKPEATEEESLNLCSLCFLLFKSEVGSPHAPAI